MKDTTGAKPTGLLKKMVGLTSTKQILRGELLRPIPLAEIRPRSDGVKPNYSVDRDPTVTLYAVKNNVSSLSREDYLLLRAIESPFDRFRVFSDPHWLVWGASLHVNSQVYVCIPDPGHSDSASTWSIAVVRYRGAVKTLPGTTFGVEIMVCVISEYLHNYYQPFRKD